jgi:hypothetical protein
MDEPVIKRILACIILYSACCPTVFAAPLFSITSTGPATQISFELCLNGPGHLSCQTFSTSALNLNIKTTIPNHTYSMAGIKILTPGYLPTGCNMTNGFCIFTVSDTAAASIPVISGTCPSQTNDLIVFSPVASTVNNPTGGTPNASQQFSINMTMCNSLGQPLIPSTSNPLHVTIYGAPNGAISPVTMNSSSGLVTFTYSGQSFKNNILVNAWITDTTTKNGVALGQTQILQQNPLACNYQNTYYEIPLTQTLPDALQIQADVGYSTSSPMTTLKTFSLDTGSLGVIVPAAELPSNADVIGPGPAGVTYYDSSGKTYSGNYYLAPVRIQTDTATVVTQPIMVLAINKAYCSGPRAATCQLAPPAPDLRYMGVGFNRPGSTPPDSTLQDLIHTPAANAFLHITNNYNGVDVAPGYVFYPSASSSTTGLRLGVDSATASSYQQFNLTPNSAVPGDFLTEYGCFGFTSTTPAVQFCGTLLLDIGIAEMFIDLPRAEWPAGTHDSDDMVPQTMPPINMSIVAGTSSQMHYTFDAVQSCPASTGPNAVAPCYVQWEDSTSSGLASVNTGRRALYGYHYYYQGQCGQVGFESY